ncbi:MAG: hypothetical protein LBU32_04160 [Clostridiales bacterium]|nr:hypothetical protein [Clostridiales bacterium]
MKLSEFLFKSYGCNEPIYVDEVEYDTYSRSWIFNEFKKIVDSGDMKRFDKGIYYFPSSPDDDAGLDPQKIIQKRFIASGVDVYGYISGKSLLSDMGLSKENPAMLELVTNNESSNMRVITIGPVQVKARRSRTTVTRWNSKTLQYLDLIKELNLDQLDEARKRIMEKYIMDSTFTREAILEYGRFFSAKVARQALDYFDAVLLDKYSPKHAESFSVADYFSESDYSAYSKSKSIPDENADREAV